MPMCDQSFSLLLSTDFISNGQFHLLWKLFLFNRVDTIVNFENKMRRVDGALLVESEAGSVNVAAAKSRPSNWDTFSPSQKSMWRRSNK